MIHSVRDRKPNLRFFTESGEPLSAETRGGTGSGKPSKNETTY